MAVPFFVRKILRFSFEPCGYRCILTTARGENEWYDDEDEWDDGEEEW